MSKIITSINGKIYDLTDYIDEHPGGSDVIEYYKDCDCTQDFKDIGHSEEAIEQLKKYYIKDGKLKDKFDSTNWFSAIVFFLKKLIFRYKTE